MQKILHQGGGGLSEVDFLHFFKSRPEMQRKMFPFVREKIILTKAIYFIFQQSHNFWDRCKSQCLEHEFDSGSKNEHLFAKFRFRCRVPFSIIRTQLNQVLVGVNRLKMEAKIQTKTVSGTLISPFSKDKKKTSRINKEK